MHLPIGDPPIQQSGTKSMNLTNPWQKNQSRSPTLGVDPRDKFRKPLVIRKLDRMVLNLDRVRPSLTLQPYRFGNPSLQRHSIQRGGHQHHPKIVAHCLPKANHHADQ
jgi:hypothetical protein